LSPYYQVYTAAVIFQRIVLQLGQHVLNKRTQWTHWPIGYNRCHLSCILRSESETGAALQEVRPRYERTL